MDEEKGKKGGGKAEGEKKCGKGGSSTFFFQFGTHINLWGIFCVEQFKKTGDKQISLVFEKKKLLQGEGIIQSDNSIEMSQ